MKLIFGYGLYKIHWEKHNMRDVVIIGNLANIEDTVNQLHEKDYKILRIDFVYTMES